MSAFEYQSKSSVSISELNKLRKYIKFDKDYFDEVKPVFNEIINIFKEKKINDIDILISFNIRNNESGDNQQSVTYQLYKTIQDLFKDNDSKLDKFIYLLDKVISKNRDNVDDEEKNILIQFIIEIIIAIDNDIEEFKHNEENNSLFTSKGF
jgi:hypothetical protein